MLTRFCCYFHLRTSAIVIAWIQVMGCGFVIAGLVSPLDIVERTNSLYYDNFIYAYQPIAVMFIMESLLKIVTCFFLIWGIATVCVFLKMQWAILSLPRNSANYKRQHLFMQPWIFFQCAENVSLSLLLLVIIISGGFMPVIYIGLVPAIIAAALGWYIWFCVREVYKEDYIRSAIYWQDRDTIPQDVNRLSYNERNRPKLMRSPSNAVTSYHNNNYGHRQY